MLQSSFFSSARLQERGQLAVRAPFQNPVVRLVGEVHVARRVRRWTFGELESVGQQFDGRARRDDTGVVGG
jgi:hypothetical protein